MDWRNKQQLLEYYRQYRKNNKRKINDIHARYRKKNKAKRNHQSKLYRIKKALQETTLQRHRMIVVDIFK